MTDHTQNDAYLMIAGPTAAGKSSLALELAEQVNGEIINADSMQLYADLRVITARPDAEEELRVPITFTVWLMVVSEPRLRRGLKWPLQRWLKFAAVAACQSSSVGPGCICQPVSLASRRSQMCQTMFINPVCRIFRMGRCCLSRGAGCAGC